MEIKEFNPEVFTFEWSNGERFWFHVSKRLLELVKKRIEGKKVSDGK